MEEREAKDRIDELVARRLGDLLDKLPPQLQTPPAAVSGGQVDGSIEELPDKLLTAVDAAIWEYNKLYNMLCIEVPKFRDHFFPLHLSLNHNGSWHVEEGETCKNPFDSNYSFYLKPTVTREGCRDAAREALEMCASYLKGHPRKSSLAQRLKELLRLTSAG